MVAALSTTLMLVRPKVANCVDPRRTKALPALAKNLVAHKANDMKRLLVAALALNFALCWAQSPTHQGTSPTGARYELIQSPLAAKWTFKLDRFAGRVWQLVRTKEDENAWEEVPVAGFIPLVDGARPRFQIFSSGLAARHTFLIDSINGKTWVLTSTKRKGSEGPEYEIVSWQPFAE